MSTAKLSLNPAPIPSSGVRPTVANEEGRSTYLATDDGATKAEGNVVLRSFRNKNTISEKQRQNGLTEWRRQTRSAIAWVALTLATVYAFLTFATFPIENLVSAVDPTQALKLIIIIYYFLWVWGVNHDTDLQELVYAAAPEGKLRASDIGVIVLIFAVSALLLWSIGSEKRFAGSLTLFFVVNVFSWRWLLVAINPAIRASREIYRTAEDFFSLERLDNFVQYISGRWQLFRFVAMGIILALMDTVTFFTVPRHFISDVSAQIYPKLSSAQFSAILPVAFFVLFTVIEEGWIWLMRLRIDVVLNVTLDLEQKYEIHPKSE